MGKAKWTPGRWKAFNMVNADNAPMTAAEIGEYVKNSVLKSIEDGGTADRFLFISTEEGGAPDICIVGNGPRGPYNAALIAAAPELYEALADLFENKCSKHCDWEAARLALRKARGGGE